jgi:DNA-binding NtrC family response regulator
LFKLAFANYATKGSVSGAIMSTGSGCQILIIDDDVQVAETLELIFLSRGYQVRLAHSADDAIELIADWEPTLAIVRVTLPQMNGIQFRDVLHSNYPDCKVVLMSGHSATDELLKPTGNDANPLQQIVDKPLHPAHILEIVADLLPGVTGEA